MITSIQVKFSTKDRLTALGAMRDSYDDVISRILDHYEGCSLGKQDSEHLKGEAPLDNASSPERKQDATSRS